MYSSSTFVFTTRGLARIALLGGVLWLPACASFFGDLKSPTGARDSAPNVVMQASRISDATPRVEPKSRGGNRSVYTVFGKQYRVLDSADGFVERGDASWYGKKFHGRDTANGERYDMYQMTAAHKHLPLPSYVQVTNLENGKRIIVRVNDRGPFHGGRIIDLSYAAATKLDMLQKGTARVEVEVIDAKAWLEARRQPTQKSARTAALASAAAVQSPATGDELSNQAPPPLVAAAATSPATVVASAPPLTATATATATTAATATNRSPSQMISQAPGQTMATAPVLAPAQRHYLQVAAYQDLAAAQGMQNRLLDSMNSGGLPAPAHNVVIHPSASNLYRVRIGPVASRQEVEQLRAHPLLDSFGTMYPVVD